MARNSTLSGNMENLEILSDDELRRRLLQYGFENLPITQTTRKTLIKKLRNHLASANNNLRKTTSITTRYSSGEESDSLDNSSQSRKSRMTVSGSPGNTTFQSFDQRMPPPSFPSPRTTTSTPIYNRNAASSIAGKKSSVYVSPVIINDSEDDDIDWTKARTTNNNSKNAPVRSRSSELFTTMDSSRSMNGTNGADQDDSDDPNSTSDYTRRLLQFREGNIQRQNSNFRKRSAYSREYPSVNENDIVFHAEPSLEPANIPLNTAIRNFINRLDAAYGFKQTFVPMVLVTFLIVFFLLIIFVYVTISPDIENILSPSSTFYVSCESNQELGASYNCIEEQSLDSSLNLLKVLVPELQKRARDFRCGDQSDRTSSVMCIKDFWHYLSDNQLHTRYSTQHSLGLDLLKDMHNIEYLVDQNKQWGIQNVNENGEPISFEEVVAMRPHQTECLAISKPKIPLTCTILNKLQTFFVIIGSLAIISSIVFIVRKFYQFVLQIRQKRRAQVDHIIREICNTLMEKTIYDKDNNSVITNHLRDKIIDPSKRTEFAWAWQEALSYLEKNDSRVHFGVETINGEDFKVMRWIDDIKNMSATNQQMSQQQQQQTLQQQQRLNAARYTQKPDGRPQYATLKKWMGSAFDRSNKIKDPPTNCLKIRQMFDKYEINNQNLQTIIQDTILHKVKHRNCKIYGNFKLFAKFSWRQFLAFFLFFILDIQLDLKTCCVYVKCGSCADAGIIHEEINGWWLESGLVVVKFLKQDKYHMRFPSSINATTVLQPSSNVYLTQSDSNGQYFDDIDDIDDDDFE